MGADYYESDEQRAALLASGGVPVGIGANSVITNAIIDKNARVGECLGWYRVGCGGSWATGTGVGVHQAANAQLLFMEVSCMASARRLPASVVHTLSSPWIHPSSQSTQLCLPVDLTPSTVCPVLTP